MFTTQPTDIDAWIATIDVPTGIALASALIIALTLIDILARRLTASARARAQARAQQWAAHRAARARRKARLKARDRARSRSFMDTPAARRAILAVLTATAAAATVLSAHGVQDALTDAGITTWWARLAGIAAFEGFLLVMAFLSWWHRTTGQDGADIYGSLVWAGAAVLALVGYHGGGDWIYAVFAPLAALGFHLLTGAERRRRGAGTTWVARLGAAARARAERIAVWLGRTPTSADTSARDAERRYSRIVHRRVKAQRARRARAWRAWLFDRALADAESRGLLDEAGRARIAERVAARYSAFDALAPDALSAAASMWSRTAPVTEHTPEPTPSPSPSSAPELEPEASSRPPLAAVPALPDPDAARDVILAAFPARAPRDAAAWCAAYYEQHGTLPTGRQLGDAAGTHPGNARKWLAPVRAALTA